MDIYIARQPIFDTKEKVHAYELLFRSGPQNFFPAGTDGDHASSKLIHDSVHTFGLDQLSGEKPVFINMTKQLLVQEMFTVLPPAKTVVEVLETVEPTDDVVEACRAARKAGYTLALDDFIFDAKYEPLLKLANIIKIDFMATKGEERARVVERLKPYKVDLLAEKVETKEEYAEAVKLGYRYFQGYFFCKPEMLNAKEVPQFKLNYLNLLKELNTSNIDMDKLVEIVRHDPSLSVKLLRYLNSAFFGWRSEITSLRHAVTLLGLNGFKKWASLMTLAGMGSDKPDELLVTCLVRGKFCEQIGELARSDKNTDYFLIGLLSAIDVFFGRPLNEMLAKLALSKEMTTALLSACDPASVAAGEKKSQATHALSLILAYERADWKGIDDHRSALNLDETQLPGMYEKAVSSARQSLQM